MEESDAYLAILEEGEVRGVGKAILMPGQDRLGSPDESVQAVQGGITDLDRLIRIVCRTPDAMGWRELLETP